MILSTKTVESLTAIFAEKYPEVWAAYEAAKPGSIVVVYVDSQREVSDLRNAIGDAKLEHAWTQERNQVWVQKPDLKWYKRLL